MMNSEVLSLFHPKIQPFISELIKSGRVGVCSNSLRIYEVLSGHPVIEPTFVAENGDRFKLALPFAGQSIVWNVIFDGDNPELAPDFFFDDESFLADPDISTIEEYVPSLANWDTENPKSLLNVVSELVSLYRKHQIDQLNEATHTRLQFEYSCLLCNKLIKEEDIEVLCSRSASKTRQGSGAVSFMIRLKIDFSGLPPIQTSANTGDDAAILLVTFHSPNWNRITPQLFLSPTVESALGTAFHLPVFPQNNCMLEYVPLVIEQLTDRINTVITSYEKKKEFIAHLMFAIGKSVIEYDTTTFLRASFLLERKDFYFMLHITLPNSFPRDRPVFQLHSVYHFVQGKTFRYRYDDCPHSPRWEVSEMADRAISYIEDHIEHFQRSSIQSCII